MASLGGEKTRYNVAGAGHYYLDQPEHLAEAANVCASWLQKQGLYLPTAW